MVGVEADEILSRNGLEDFGPIDLRIASKQAAASEINLTKVAKPSKPASPDDLKGNNVHPNSKVGMKELQFSRHHQSKS
jgi:hypothetical protein